jgi:WD40 repeat protein
MGETGYKPRILIFSNKGDSSETPVCALAEHTFGVHALAFSPDSKYLASLGTVNDGFLYIWSIDDKTGAATLHSSNKCTTTINAMTWVGRSVLTVGVRCVRLWRPGDDTISERRGSETTSNISTPRQKASDFGNSILSPKHKLLSGKSSLLNELLEANFVAALAISDDKAVVCAESGEVCVIDDCQNAQSLTSFATTEFRISSAAFDGFGGVIVSGGSGQSKTFQLGELEQRRPTSARRSKRQTMSPQKSLPVDSNPTIAMATFQGITVELDSKRGIRLSRSRDSNQHYEDSPTHQLAAHNEAVQGVQEYTSDALPGAAFLSFSVNGCIQIWDVDGAVVTTLMIPVNSSPEMYDLTNELRAVRPLRNSSYLAAGDKYGMLSLLDVSTGKVVTQVRAHSTEVVDIVTLERPGAQFVTTASRDRTIQLFACTDAKLELLQTMDEHAAAVSSLVVAEGGEMLLSCSTDRTVVVRKIMARRDNPTAVAFDMVRTITLKSSPTSMCLTDGDDILVATVDRCIGTHNIKTGQAGFSFKCSDTEGGEAAALSKILYTPSLNGNPTIVGVSSGDKSVRLYSEYGSLIARDWGHTEGITDVLLLTSKAAEDDDQSSRPQIVTVAADSTIFMWDTISQAVYVAPPQPEVNGAVDTPVASKLTTPMAPPMRKVLSFSELSRFRRESSIGDGELSPPATGTPTQHPPPPPSPPRVKKKTSRMSLAQPPRLEPAFKASFADPARRRRRSPSPPSPRITAKKDASRKASLGMSLRSKSSENVLSSYAPVGANTGFGSVTSSTESVCRTLRAYRKKLTNSATSDIIAPDVLRELEKELKLTARVVGEKSQGKNLDEAMMTKLLDQASEKIVSRLDERIKERVESEVRKSGEGSPSGVVMSESPKEIEGQDMDAVVGALEKVAIDDKKDGK